jgi:hypothetical protein
MPIPLVIIGAIVLFLLYYIKHTVNLSEVNTVIMEVPMKTAIKLKAIIMDIYITIGSKIALGWLLPARFYRTLIIMPNGFVPENYKNYLLNKIPYL